MKVEIRITVVLVGEREGTKARTLFRVVTVPSVLTGVLFACMYVFINTHQTVTSTVCN